MADNINGPVIAVIEWLVDRGANPTVFLADTAAAARRAVFQHLAPMAARSSIEDIDAQWRAENPAPDADDAAAVDAWLAALRDASTDAWLTLYGNGSTPGSDTYADVRTEPR